jgi:2-oxoglutarate dehydrogenase E1 component
MDKFSWLNNSDPAFIEDQYQRFKENPDAVDESWRMFFEGYEFARQDYSPSADDSDLFPDEFKVITLINAYRQRGHLFTETNPVRKRRKYLPTLDLENFDLSESDLDREFQAGKEIGIGKATLRDIVAHLRETYCRSGGAEF